MRLTAVRCYVGRRPATRQLPRNVVSARISHRQQSPVHRSALPDVLRRTRRTRPRTGASRSRLRTGKSKENVVMPLALGGGHFGIARSVRLFVPLRSCLGYRHAGCLQLSHRRPPEMCGLRTRPLTDVDPP